MVWWEQITALGGLHLTAAMAVAIGAWLAAARCWRLALAWCLLFGAAMVLAVASQVAFIGWGIGVRAVDFAGFSGHAARAAAVFPVALFVLLEGRPQWLRVAGAALGALLAAAVAVSRVKLGAHAASEALLGFALGLGVALLFMARARAALHFALSPLLVGLSLAILLLMPAAEPPNTQQWMTALALKLSGQDRPYLRGGWRQARQPYVPPCPQEKVRFTYMCT
jgi:membrane-associated phospholipid phosphatase